MEDIFALIGRTPSVAELQAAATLTETMLAKILATAAALEARCMQSQNPEIPERLANLTRLANLAHDHLAIIRQRISAASAAAANDRPPAAP